MTEDLIFYYSVKCFPLNKKIPIKRKETMKKKNKNKNHCIVLFLKFKFQGTFSRGCTVTTQLQNVNMFLANIIIN